MKSDPEAVVDSKLGMVTTPFGIILVNAFMVNHIRFGFLLHETVA
jgi:hypothetical protein